MNFLALDLGTHTGYASLVNGEFNTGTWTLLSPSDIRKQAKLRYDRRQDARIPNLEKKLNVSYKIARLDWIFFEDVQFASTCKQAHLWASLRAVLWLYSEQWGIQIECCPTGTLKLFATGYGGATKEQMERAARKKYPDWLATRIGLDDNAFDATHLLAWGIQTVSRGK